MYDDNCIGIEYLKEIELKFLSLIVCNLFVDLNSINLVLSNINKINNIK